MEDKYDARLYLRQVSLSGSVQLDLGTFPCRLQCLYSLVMMLSSSIGLVSAPSPKSWCISMKKT